MSTKKPVRIQHRHIMKAVRARKPAPDQTALLLLRDKLEEKLSEISLSEMIYFHKDVYDSEMELLHISEDEDGYIFLSVVDHRLVDIGLHELEISEEESMAIVEELRRLSAALKTKKVGKPAGPETVQV